MEKKEDVGNKDKEIKSPRPFFYVYGKCVRCLFFGVLVNFESPREMKPPLGGV